MEVVFLFFSFLFFFFPAFSVEVKPLQLLPAKKIFEIEIANPKALVICSNLLWTYSEKEKKLLGLSPDTGEALNQIPTTVGIQDISCFRERVLILSSDRNQQQLYELNKKDLKKISPISTRDWVTRLSCQKEKCWATGKKIYSSSDLKKWQIEKIPVVTELKKETFNPEINPFEDWQSSLNLAQAGYHDLTVSPEGNLALLDSFHGLVASQYQNQWWKWGQYGVWEGNVLLPKKIKYLSNHVLAVADNGLKAIFLFTREGRYLGALSHEKNYILSFDLVSGLESIKGRVFIADFVKNKIFALDIQSLDSMTPEAEGIQFRQNLFRYHAVQQDYVAPVCLNCHDGTVVNHLKVFTEKKNKHPISCTSCHDQHHTQKAKYNLLKPEHDLCLSCHSAQALPETNHVWKHGKKGGSCLDCHSSHSGNYKLLVKQPPSLCMECHKNQNISHREVKDLLQNERAKGLSFLDGKINCLTCHQTHENWRQGGFIKDRDQVRIFCASCHGQKTDRVYKDFHKLLNAKGAKK